MRVKLTLEVEYETLEGEDILDPELAEAITQQLRNAAWTLEDHGLLSGDLPAAGHRRRVLAEITECDDRLYEVPTGTLEGKDETGIDDDGDSA